MLVLLGLAFCLACGACFGLGWFARGERVAREGGKLALSAWRASEAASAKAQETKAAVAQETQELAAEDSLGSLLDEKVPPR